MLLIQLSQTDFLNLDHVKNLAIYPKEPGSDGYSLRVSYSDGSEEEMYFESVRFYLKALNLLREKAAND